MAEGKGGLLHSSTGSGKTLAVWMGLLNQMPKGKGLTALWLTPLRALAADTLQSLQAPLEGMGLDWRVELRTGDTSSHAKQKQMKNLPDALITTPESLSILLSQAGAQDLLKDLQLVVVDEWHELLGTKRGVQTELALARLRRFAAGLKTWGLSATLGNTEFAAEALLGNPAPEYTIVKGESEKQILIDSLLPESIERFPWSGHIGTKMVPQVADELANTGSALVFTNTRAQAEIWFQALLAERPEFSGKIELHHGSLDLEVRAAVEQGLKLGLLKAVVCTSSLDLGVDFSPVERVFQIGSPKGVARLLQRAGRSGHRPGQVSRVTCVPTHSLELIEIAAAREAAAQGRIEARAYFERPVDVLGQHLVTIALGGGFTSEELLEEVRTTRAYQNLTNQEWEGVLEYVTKGGSSLSAYPEYRKVVVREGRYVVEDRMIAARHRMNIGTIVSDSAMNVQVLKGGSLGTVEESFVSRLKRGDRFIFSGRPLEFVMVKDMTCWVRKVASPKGAIPRWAGGRMPLSSELSDAARHKLEDARDGILEGPEMQLAKGMLEVQAAWSSIPRSNEFLIEQVRTRDGYHTFFYPFEGRLVHEGLAALFAYRLSRQRPTTFSMACNDYGLELLSPVPVKFDDDSLADLLNPLRVEDDIWASLNSSEMSKRQFREIARVAGLVNQTLPGKQKTTKQMQASSSLIYDVFEKYDPDHPLLQQAQREVLEKNLEETRLLACLKRLNQSQILIEAPPRPTPFCVPILVDRLRETISSETLGDQIARLIAGLEEAAEVPQ